jgi:hypothetical protein
MFENAISPSHHEWTAFVIHAVWRYGFMIVLSLLSIFAERSVNVQGHKSYIVRGIERMHVC